MTFKIMDTCGIKDGMQYSHKVDFFNDNNGKLEAEYYYNDTKVNYLISWGFNKGSVEESRKVKASKVKKPYFNLKDGWYG